MRQPKSLDERLWQLALTEWYQWYLRFLAPVEPAAHGADGDVDERVFEVFARKIRSNTEVGDTLLARLLTAEQRRWDWPASIHEIICEYPTMWQGVILACAQGKHSDDMARAFRISKSGAEAVVSLVKSRLVPRLMLLGNTRRQVRRHLGIVVPPAMGMRMAVND